MIEQYERTLPIETKNMQQYILQWSTIYRGDAEWLDCDYVDMQAVKRKRRRKQMRAAKLICSEIAGLVWAEKPDIKAHARAKDVLNRSNFYELLRKYTEYGAADGGFALKLYRKDMLLHVDYVRASMFIPVSWNASGVTEADFIGTNVVDGKTYVIIEQHRKEGAGYSLKTLVYDVTGGKKAVEVRPESIGLSSEPVKLSTDVPAFVYIPTPQANNLVRNTPLGISMYANATDTLEALDVAFDGLNQELILGRKRIIVPASAIRYVTDDKGNRVRYFDPSDEVFTALKTDDKEQLKITDNSMTLRVAEIRQAIQTYLNILCVQIGFSPGTLTFDGAGVKTATEVISENSKTHKTKSNYTNSLAKGIEQLIYAIHEIEGVTEHIDVQFDDSVIEDRTSRMNYWLDRYAAKTCTLETVLKHLDGVSDEEAEILAGKIREQNATVNIDSITGGA